ncbi:YdeI/OmpD-associated family protein [Fulvivirga ligni]|uniref:YdeI/OmpD-associated family protein n=1 Tax=Fulvivirga ligni TaxID=2904246 RepID=UPI00278C130A|nr:YdeI/OmpD-associated family protein [Fulvivirga ligni]
MTKDIETFCPKSRTDWRKWLEKNHQSKQSVWLVYFKTSTKVPSISWSEAVDEAICFGWIDSTKKAVDEKRYMQYFSKRKPNSIWSKVNKEKVEKLIANGRMRESGFNSIQVAKQNGSWLILDDVEALVVPEDLKEALENYHEATEFFNSLSKSSKKILLHWVMSAKRPETRRKRVLEIALSASKRQKPKQFQ